MNIYVNSYLVVFLFFLPGSLLSAGAFMPGKLLRPKPASSAVTYESGIESFQNAWINFSPKYYQFALLFVLFDLEALFCSRGRYPLTGWASLSYGKCCFLSPSYFSG